MIPIELTTRDVHVPMNLIVYSNTKEGFLNIPFKSPRGPMALLVSPGPDGFLYRPFAGRMISRSIWTWCAVPTHQNTMLAYPRIPHNHAVDTISLMHFSFNRTRSDVDSPVHHPS